MIPWPGTFWKLGYVSDQVTESFASPGKGAGVCVEPTLS